MKKKKSKKDIVWVGDGIYDRSKRGGFTTKITIKKIMEYFNKILDDGKHL